MLPLAQASEPETDVSQLAAPFEQTLLVLVPLKSKPGAEMSKWFWSLQMLLLAPGHRLLTRTIIFCNFGVPELHPPGFVSK
jgi:hypothetical protein